MNLNQITISVSNIEKSIEFYEKIGLQLIVKAPHYARFVCPDGQSTFSLHIATEPICNTHTSIYFEENNLDDKVRELQAKGIKFDELPIDKPWLWRESRLRDPDNNLSVLYFGGENRLNPPWRIK